MFLSTCPTFGHGTNYDRLWFETHTNCVSLQLRYIDLSLLMLDSIIIYLNLNIENDISKPLETLSLAISHLFNKIYVWFGMYDNLGRS